MNSDLPHASFLIEPVCSDDECKTDLIHELVCTDFVPTDIFETFSIEEIRHNMYPIYVFNVNWSANWSAVYSHQVSHEEPTYDFNGKRTGTKTVYETQYRDANGTSAGDCRVVLSGIWFANQSEICQDCFNPEKEKPILNADKEVLYSWDFIDPVIDENESWQIRGGEDILVTHVDYGVMRDIRSMSNGWTVDRSNYTYRYSNGDNHCVLIPIWEADFRYGEMAYTASVATHIGGKAYMEDYPKDETEVSFNDEQKERISECKTQRAWGYSFFGVFAALAILFLALPSFSENRILFSLMFVLAVVSWVITRNVQKKILKLKNELDNRLWDKKVKRSEAAKKRFGIKVPIGEEPEKQKLELGVDALVYVLFGIVFFIAITQGLFVGNRPKYHNKPHTSYQSSINPKNNVQNTPSTTKPMRNEQSHKVYSNAYDGYINIRESPHSNAPVIGVFKNGPDGAILLSREGDWTKIEYNGIVGYVYTKYVQDVPTVAYTGTATIDQIAGVYDNFGFSLFLYFDGTYCIGGEASVLERGRYILQNNEVKLMPLYSDFSESEEQILPIDVANKKVGNYKKQPFLTESEISRAKAKYGEDWFGELYMDEYAFAGTLKDFKKLSALE